MAARRASVQDLLDSIEIGLPGEETSIAAALTDYYQLPEDCDLSGELANRDVDEVLGVMLTAAEPFAALLLEVFDFVGCLDAAVAGHVEVEIGAGVADSLRLDPDRFKHYEREVVRGAMRRVDLDHLLAGPDRGWGGWHDWFWPFHCVQQAGEPLAEDLCEGCPSPERIAEFAWVRDAFEGLSSQARERLERTRQSHDREDFRVRQLAETWPREVRRRGRVAGYGCPMGHFEWFKELWPGVLAELRGAQVSGSFEELRRLLALPYWKHRWQLYEVWLLAQVLDAVGLDRIELVLDDGVWALPVGRHAKTPVAQIPAHGATVWYQHQREPTAGLFASKEHRPEIIIDTPGDGSVLLVAEAKARRGLDRDDVEAVLFPLLQWQPRAALVANYFAVNRAPPLSETSQGDSALAASSDCQPLGPGAAQTRAWLRGQCEALLPRPLAVIVCDVSSSMHHDDARVVVDDIASRAARVAYVLFADTAAIGHSGFDDIPRQQLGGGTNLQAAREALATLQEELRAPRAEVHLVSDLDLPSSGHELDALIGELDQHGAKVVVHSWPSEALERTRQASSRLDACLVIRGGPPG